MWFGLPNPRKTGLGRLPQRASLLSLAFLHLRVCLPLWQLLPMAASGLLNLAGIGLGTCFPPGRSASFPSLLFRVSQVASHVGKMGHSGSPSLKATRLDALPQQG